MKVILMQEVKGKGGEGDVVDVARGFAVNFLLPRRMAVAATRGNLKQLEARMENIRKRDEGRISDATGLKGSLDEKTVTIEAKVGEEGRLFGSVTGAMIEAAILEQLGVQVDRKKIDIHTHIKEAGEHAVTVQVYREVKANLTVKVVSEDGEVAVAEPVVVETADEVVAEDAATVESSDEAADVVEETADEAAE
ncbi:MAG: 50S ribosomal protein L9 [Actinomycetota bacterium]|jgi:large subunit ribosomal protein L9|nr:50S ribosomal protein L9 [Actinomycetota bacterium]